MADHNSRVSRWVEILGAYTYTVYHQPGAQNSHADMLFRLSLPATEVGCSRHFRLTYPDEVASYTKYYSSYGQLGVRTYFCRCWVG